MWVFTQNGFISAVANDRDSNLLTVRARDKESLELLADLTSSEIVELPNRDYEYRVFVSREDFSNFLLMHVESIDYTNFKNRVHATRGDVYHDACSDVWGAMLQVSDKYPTAKIR